MTSLEERFWAAVRTYGLLAGGEADGLRSCIKGVHTPAVT